MDVNGYACACDVLNQNVPLKMCVKILECW